MDRIPHHMEKWPKPDSNMGHLPRQNIVLHNQSRRNSTPESLQSARRQHKGQSLRLVAPFLRNNSFPMTVDQTRPRAKICGNMELFNQDYNLSPCGDHVLPNSDLTMYAVSPNSLHMYDQEKYDMQNYAKYLQPRSQQKPENCSSLDDFDLNPLYENNCEMVTNIVTERPEGQTVSEFQNFNAQAGMNSDVTLTELNSNWNSESESLLDDLDTIIRSPKTVSYPNTLITNNFTMATQQTQSSSNFLANQQPVSQADFRQYIKAEPSTVSMWSNTCHQPTFTASATPAVKKETTVSPPQVNSFYSASATETVPKEESKVLLQKLLMNNNPSESSTVDISSVLGQKSPVEPVKEESQDSVEEKWKEIEKYIHDDENDCSRPTRAKRKRFNSGSSFAASFGEESMDDDSSDEDWSDTEIDLPNGSVSVLDDGKKGEKYFWQYNVQSKGPKGTKLKLHLDSDNPHKLSSFEDPVFDPQNTKAGIRHGGKARKGDGNDIVPSPKKLFGLGQQIRKLNMLINEVSPSNDQPASVRNESRKRKNKLASRACRLKKKAQHEANKVKLYGLEKEHSELLQVIKTIRHLLVKRVTEMDELKEIDKEKMINKLEDLINKHLTLKIAGNAADFVNNVIKTVENGDPTGGIKVEKKPYRK